MRSLLGKSSDMNGHRKVDKILGNKGPYVYTKMNDTDQAMEKHLRSGVIGSNLCFRIIILSVDGKLDGG